MADYNLLTAEEVAEVLPKPTRQSSMPASPQGDLYRSAKVPFAFNYIDEDLDVTHDNDSQGRPWYPRLRHCHGQHLCVV